MNDKLNILEPYVLELIDNKKAKPNKTIKEHTLDLLEQLENLSNLGYINDEKLYNLVAKACIYHDLGKINDQFQQRILNRKKFNPSKEVVHNILSLYFIDRKNFDSEEDYLKVAHSVVNHHNYCNIFEEIREKEELIKELLEPFKTQEVEMDILSELCEIIDNTESIKVKGYLHKCDYSASSGNVAEYPNDFLQQSLNSLLLKWKKENLIKRK